MGGLSEEKGLAKAWDEVILTLNFIGREVVKQIKNVILLGKFWVGKDFFGKRFCSGQFVLSAFNNIKINLTWGFQMACKLL